MNWTKYLQYLIIFCILCWIASFAVGVSALVPTQQLDGAFQTASGLYRLSHGDLPGRDFFPYLGIGPLGLLYPLFCLLKSLGCPPLLASNLAAKSLTLIVGWLGVAALWQWMLRPKWFCTALVWGGFIFILPLSLNGLLEGNFWGSTAGIAPQWAGTILPASWLSMTEPGNSLRPVRTALPVLLALSAWFLVFRQGHEPARRPWVQALTAGALSGLALLWSNDYALPGTGLFGLLMTGWFVRQPLSWKARLVLLALYGLSTLVVGGLAFLLVTDGNVLALWRYNFLDVAKDQWWFFAGYDPTSRIFTFSDLAYLLGVDLPFPCAMLALTVYMTWREPTVERLLTAYVGVTLLAGGLAASVMGHLGDYFEAFRFYGCITALFWTFHAVRVPAEEIQGEAFTRLITATHIRVGGFLAACALGMALWAGSIWRWVETDPGHVFSPEFGAYFKRTWAKSLDDMRAFDAELAALPAAARETAVLEEYWGMWSLLRNGRSPWPVDSTIHALGSVRQRAAQVLENSTREGTGPLFVTTTRHSNSPNWLAWNLTQNFWFYDRLLQAWEPVALTPRTVIWRRAAHKTPPVPLSADACVVRSGEGPSALPSLRLRVPEPGFYRLRVQYALQGTGRHLLRLRNNFSYAVDAKGYASLDPAAHEAVLPVYAAHAGELDLDFLVHGPTPATLTITGCELARLPVPRAHADEILVPPLPKQVSDM